jgi:hypothetical protein
LVSLGLLTASVHPCAAEERHDSPPDETSSLEISRCVVDHENARSLRLEKRWLEARETMNRCAREICPVAIRSDCRDWSEEVTRTLPTLVILVERGDGGAGPVAVHLDGAQLDISDGTTPVEVLPGRHSLRFTLSGHPAIVREVVLHEGEKNRVVRVRFEKLAAPSPREQAPLLPVAEEEPTRPIPTSTYVLGTTALVTFAISSVLLVSALSDLDNARDTCSPECPTSSRESIETRLLLADVSGGVGLLLTGLTAYTFATRPEQPPRKTSPSRFAPGPGRALGVGWKVQF